MVADLARWGRAIPEWDLWLVAAGLEDLACQVDAAGT